MLLLLLLLLPPPSNEAQLSRASHITPCIALHTAPHRLTPHRGRRRTHPCTTCRHTTQHTPHSLMPPHSAPTRVPHVGAAVAVVLVPAAHHHAHGKLQAAPGRQSGSIKPIGSHPAEQCFEEIPHCHQALMQAPHHSPQTHRRRPHAPGIRVGHIIDAGDGRAVEADAAQLGAGESPAHT